MIKINLLPFRAARKRENVRRQVSIYLLCMLFLFCVMGYLHVSLGGRLDRLKTREESLQKELKSYASVTQGKSPNSRGIPRISTPGWASSKNLKNSGSVR